MSSRSTLRRKKVLARAQAGDCRFRQSNRHGGDPRAIAAKIFGGKPSPQPVQQPVVATQALTTEKELARQALAHFSRAQELLRQGDWAGYGDELKKVEALLREMQKSR